MNEPGLIKGANFACLHAGPKEAWQEYRLKRPEVPVPVRGKLFVKKYLETSGMEMSLTVFLPGEGYPFLHRHRLNEEMYVVLSGRGEFWIDGELVEVSEGSVVRMAPAAVRTFRNTGPDPACLLVIQARAGSGIEAGPVDGEGVAGPLPWTA